MDYSFSAPFLFAGMDYLCGCLVYFDEVTSDFGSNDSARIEYLKSVTVRRNSNSLTRVPSNPFPNPSDGATRQ